MEFRWIAGITLWTMLSGPVLIHWSAAIPRPSSEPPARVDLQPPLPSKTGGAEPTWTIPAILDDSF